MGPIDQYISWCYCLQDIVDKFLLRTEGHPLALALIATSIDWERRNELGTWERAFEDFAKVLRSKRTNHVVGDNYSKSLFAAIQLSIQRLTNDGKKLLVLVHLCDGSCMIPEEVVCFLYKYGHLQEDNGTFEALRMELTSLHLLTISSSFSSKPTPERRAWSIHSLLNLFIENEMSKEKNAMITTLTGLLDRVDSLSRAGPTSTIPTDEETMIVLCALYSYPNFALTVASKMQIPIHRFDMLRKNVIEPISRFARKYSLDNSC